MKLFKLLYLFNSSLPQTGQTQQKQTNQPTNQPHKTPKQTEKAIERGFTQQKSHQQI